MKNIKVNPNQEKYWKDRLHLSESMSDKTEDEIMSTMQKVYKESLSNITKEINNFYAKYADQNNLELADVRKRLNPEELKSAKEEMARYYEQIDKLARKSGKVSAKLLNQYKDIIREQSAKAYMSRLEELKLAITQEAIKLGVREASEFDSNFSKLYEDIYSRKSYEIDKYRGFSNGFSERNVEKAINERWLGENYSDRIWKNKDKLVNNIETVFLQGLARGQGPGKIASQLQKTMQTSFYNCERLARTETIHILNEATYDSYKDHNVEKYQFVCGLDERTCDICGSLDGEVFELKDKREGVNYPVLHPQCRCTTIAYFEPDEIDAMFEESTRIARSGDGELYDIPAHITYDEWKELMTSSYDERQSSVYALGIPPSEQLKTYKIKSDDIIEIENNYLKNYKFPNLITRDQINGVERNAPMRFLIANGGRVNPHRSKYHTIYTQDGYDLNCQTCVVVFEARLRGFDVMAKPNPRIKNSASDILSKHSNSAWINSETGTPPRYYTVEKSVNNLNSCYDWLSVNIKNNERCTFEWWWKGTDENGKRRGHIINVFKQDGHIVFYDGQTSQYIDTKEKYYEYFKHADFSKSDMGLLRVDNCYINQSYADKIMERYDGSADIKLK